MVSGTAGSRRLDDGVGLACLRLSALLGSVLTLLSGSCDPGAMQAPHFPPRSAVSCPGNSPLLFLVVWVAATPLEGRAP